MTMMSGAEAIAETLKRYGVELAIGFIGHSTHAIARATSERDIQTVNPATELGGAYMMVAYNYLRNAPAAVGLWHTVGSYLIPGALAEATSSRIPAVNIGFNSDSKLTARDGLQQVTSSMLGAVTRFNARAERLDKIPELLHRAFQTAEGAPAGATYVDIPFDLTFNRGAAVIPQGKPKEPSLPAPSSEDVRAAAQMLRSAKRPLLLIGGGAVRSGAGPEIRELVERMGLPFITTTTAQGVIPDSHPLSLGSAGMAGWKCANEALAEADLVLVLGSRLADWGISQGFTVQLPPAIQVDVDVARLGEFYRPEISILSDVKMFVSALAAQILPNEDLPSKWEAFRSRNQARKTEWLAAVEEAGQDDQFPMNPWRVMAELRKAISSHDIIVSDIGNHSWWVLQGVYLDEPKRLLMSFGEGMLGSAIPMGIGAKLAERDATVFVATGDGAAQYHLNELRVAAEHNAPVVVVVFNDGRYGANDMMMKGKWGEAAWTEFSNPDYVQIAKSYGADGERIESVADLGPALLRAKKSQTAYVIDVPLSREGAFLNNNASGPLFVLDGRDIPSDNSGALTTGQGTRDQ